MAVILEGKLRSALCCRVGRSSPSPLPAARLSRIWGKKILPFILFFSHTLSSCPVAVWVRRPTLGEGLACRCEDQKKSLTWRCLHTAKRCPASPHEAHRPEKIATFAATFVFFPLSFSFSHCMVHLVIRPVAMLIAAACTFLPPVRSFMFRRNAKLCPKSSVANCGRVLTFLKARATRLSFGFIDAVV